MRGHGDEAGSPGYAGRRREETRERKEAAANKTRFFPLACFLSSLAAEGGNPAVSPKIAGSL